VYIALIADVIDSKQFKERSDLQKKLEAVLFHMNNRFETYLASRLTLTLGDEFQALLTLDAPIFQIIDSLRQDLKPAQLRFGIGLGKIVTDIDPLQSIGADGPAYWNANLDRLVDMIVAEAQPTDHILVMSNGSFGGIHQKILDKLKQK